MNTTTTGQSTDFNLDDYLDRADARIVYRLPWHVRIDANNREARKGMEHYGERFRGFYYALSKGMIRCCWHDEHRLEQLFARSYVYTFVHRREALATLLADTGLLDAIEFGISGLPGQVRGLLTISEKRAWLELDEQFVFVRGQEGVHVYRRAPKPSHE